MIISVANDYINHKYNTEVIDSLLERRVKSEIIIYINIFEIPSKKIKRLSYDLLQTLHYSVF